MIWQNPWAWLGLVALGVPVLIHLLGRRSARAQRFPTLRFLQASQLTATRRTKLTDLPLLGVRMGILAAAVAALAAPLLLTANRERDLGRAVARAIIVDTSASMARRFPADGAGASRGAARRAVDGARFEANRLVSDARSSVVLETRAPALAIPGAVAWLGTQPGRRELIIVSDFQANTLAAADLGTVPAEIGIALTRVVVDSTATPLVVETRRGDETISALVSLTPTATAVEWTTAPADSTGTSDGLAILAGAGERARADAARSAALGIAAATAIPLERPVAIVHRGFESRATLLTAATPLVALWQGDLVARLSADSTLVAAASIVDARTDGRDSSGASPGGELVSVVRTQTGQPVVLAGADRVDARDRLLLFVETDAGSLASAALVAGVARASSPPGDVAELDPATIPDSTLMTWSRLAASAISSSNATDDGASDARWLWLLALALIALETWMRRGRRAVKAAEVQRERAA